MREVTVGGALSDDATADLEGLSEREQELCNARRMLRVAGWATIFYLITVRSPLFAQWGIKRTHRCGKTAHVELNSLEADWDCLPQTDILGPFNARAFGWSVRSASTSLSLTRSRPAAYAIANMGLATGKSLGPACDRPERFADQSCAQASCSMSSLALRPALPA